MSTSRTRLYEAKTRVDLAPDGVSLTFASSEQDIIEFLDDAGKVIPGQAFIQPPRDITSPELLALIGDQMPAVLAERDALQAQVAQMTADHAAALQAAADDKAKALADAATSAAADKQAALDAAAEDKAAAVKVLQDQIAALTAPPVVPTVDMVQFKLALLETASFLNAGKTLLDDANALVSGSPMNVQVLWTSAKVARDNPVLNQMAPLLVPHGQNPGAVLDQLFILAATQPG